jgi:hypothetical protein
VRKEVVRRADGVKNVVWLRVLDEREHLVETGRRLWRYPGRHPHPDHTQGIQAAHFLGAQRPVRQTLEEVAGRMGLDQHLARCRGGQP